MTDNTSSLINELVQTAIQNGADAADVVFVSGTSLSVGVRNGATESLERSETCDLGLRVFCGRKSAIVSATALEPSRFQALADRAIAMARILPDDIFGGLAPDAETGPVLPDLSAFTDNAVPYAETLLDTARKAEEAAFAINGVTNSGGAGAGYGRTDITLATSAGFSGSWARTSYSTSVSVLAGNGTGMQRDYDYHSTVFHEDLDAPELLGRNAGQKAVARLNPGRPKTGTLSVIFDPRVATSILGHLAGAINGASVARGTSFLKNRMGEKIFSDSVTIIDDPTLRRGPASRPFDGEGVLTRPLTLVENGYLQTWLLDSRSARQLNLPGNGRAARGTSSPPSPSVTNLFFRPGTVTPSELMSDIREGIYITEMMGSSINPLTGDYSRGASGFMIRNGEIAEPVAEFTIASNLNDMFARVILANDLRFRSATSSPTLRIDNMSIAGI